MKQKVLIFGTGAFVNNIIDSIKEKYEIVGFIDNASEKHGKVWNDTSYLVYQPNIISELTYDKVVIASTNYASEMFSQLLHLGIKEHDIIIDYVSYDINVYIDDLLAMQVDKHGEYDRLDIFVKYLAIESYLENDAYGINLYKKMQKKRLRLSDIQVEEDWNRFKDLIDSIRKKGYMQSSFVVCDEQLHLMDGAHRIAACIYFDVPMIPVKVVPKIYECNYSVYWFWEKEFNQTEIKNIQHIPEMYFKSKTILAVVWTSVDFCLSEIMRDINELCEITNSKILELSQRELADFVRKVYSVDDIANWKVEKKIEHLQEGKVAVLELKLCDLHFRIKNKTKQPISQKVEAIKRAIRNRYKNRVDGYFYDIILHISDNFYQSEVLRKIFSLPMDISECFESLKDHEYALSKLDVPYMPLNFPHVYPVHKDADILCSENHYVEVVSIIWKYAHQYAENNGLSVRTIELDYRKKIRIEYDGFLIYQFDITYKNVEVGKNFIEQAIKRREKKDNVYILCVDDEILIREYEYMLYPHKEYHKDYIMEKRRNECI